MLHYLYVCLGLKTQAWIKPNSDTYQPLFLFNMSHLVQVKVTWRSQSNTANGAKQTVEIWAQVPSLKHWQHCPSSDLISGAANVLKIYKFLCRIRFVFYPDLNQSVAFKQIHMITKLERKKKIAHQCLPNENCTWDDTPLLLR